MGYRILVTATSLAVFCAGWWCSFIGLSLFNFLAFGVVNNPSGRVGEQLQRLIPLLSVLIGAGWMLTVVVQVARGRASAKWLHLQLWPAALVVGLLGSVQAQFMIRQYRGWDSESAARAIVADLYGPEVAQRVTLTEVERRGLGSWWRGPHLMLLAADEEGPVCKVGVCRQWGLWWAYYGNEYLREREHP